MGNIYRKPIFYNNPPYEFVYADTDSIHIEANLKRKEMVENAKKALNAQYGKQTSIQSEARDR